MGHFLCRAAQCHTRSAAHGSQQHTIMLHRWALTLHHAERPHSFSMPLQTLRASSFHCWESVLMSYCCGNRGRPVNIQSNTCLFCPGSSVSERTHTYPLMCPRYSKWEDKTASIEVHIYIYIYIYIHTHTYCTYLCVYLSIYLSDSNVMHIYMCVYIYLSIYLSIWS